MELVVCLLQIFHSGSLALSTPSHRETVSSDIRSAQGRFDRAINEILNMDFVLAKVSSSTLYLLCTHSDVISTPASRHILAQDAVDYDYCLEEQVCRIS